MTYGATDEFGFKAVDKPVHIHDLHATMLHLLGMDHTRLTYRYSGRDFRLTDVEGAVVRRSWREASAEQAACPGLIDAEDAFVENGQSFDHLIDVGAFVEHDFVFDPVGERQISEEDALFDDQALAVEEEEPVLADVVALFDAHIGEKFIERFAAAGLLGSLEGLFEVLLVRIHGAAGLCERLAFPGDEDLHPALHHKPDQQAGSQCHEGREQDPQECIHGTILTAALCAAGAGGLLFTLAAVDLLARGEIAEFAQAQREEGAEGRADARLQASEEAVALGHIDGAGDGLVGAEEGGIASAGFVADVDTGQARDFLSRPTDLETQLTVAAVLAVALVDLAHGSDEKSPHEKGGAGDLGGFDRLAPGCKRRRAIYDFRADGRQILARVEDCRHLPGGLGGQFGVFVQEEDILGLRCPDTDIERFGQSEIAGHANELRGGEIGFHGGAAVARSVIYNNQLDILAIVGTLDRLQAAAQQAGAVMGDHQDGDAGFLGLGQFLMFGDRLGDDGNGSFAFLSLTGGATKSHIQTSGYRFRQPDRTGA